jgi:ParB/RepB/Spo0J family partition protein
MTSGIFHLQPIQEIHFDRSSRQRKNIDDLDGLKESIKRLGLIHPIVITREHELVAGERRLASCRELGWTTIPIQFVDEVDPRILSCIEHEENTRRKNLTWQEENDTVVAQYKLWKDIEPEASVDKIGLFLNRSGSSIREHIEVKEERERSPSLERELTFKEAKKIAYNNKEKRAKDELYTHGATGAVHIQSPETYFQLLKSLSINLDNFCSPSAHMIFWFSSKFFCQTWELLKLLDGFQFDELPLIWVRDDQQGIVPDRHKRPRRIYETAFFGWRGDRSLIRVKNNAFIGPSPRGTHAHEKSQDALEYFFEMVVDGNTAIFDPTCGSGSALRAAKRLGAKQMLGLEINKEFADDALRALAAAPTP